ncbi:MAG: type II toxin-antitoxin system RelE/ParE family toxin [Alphaproteobacteria bacterium]|nr:type II toxin-antitoxin system RelE/ParE family toxin [Alphaproteobacteria bacterium]
MKKHQLVYTITAQHDLDAIFDYIVDESGYASKADAFVLKLEKKCEEIARVPFHIGKNRSNLREDMRSLPFGNYVIFFRYIDDTVEIINILQGHRDIEGFYEKA